MAELTGCIRLNNIPGGCNSSQIQGQFLSSSPRPVRRIWHWLSVHPSWNPCWPSLCNCVLQGVSFHCLFPPECVSAVQPSSLSPHLLGPNAHTASPHGYLIGTLSKIFPKLNKRKGSMEGKRSLHLSNSKKDNFVGAKEVKSDHRKSLSVSQKHDFLSPPIPASVCSRLHSASQFTKW